MRVGRRNTSLLNGPVSASLEEHTNPSTVSRRNANAKTSNGQSEKHEPPHVVSKFKGETRASSTIQSLQLQQKTRTSQHQPMQWFSLCYCSSASVDIKNPSTSSRRKSKAESPQVVSRRNTGLRMWSATSKEKHEPRQWFSLCNSSSSSQHQPLKVVLESFQYPHKEPQYVQNCIHQAVVLGCRMFRV